MSVADPSKKVYCTNCGAWQYALAIELGYPHTSNWWLTLEGAPSAYGFGPPRLFCSMRCVAEHATQESRVFA